MITLPVLLCLISFSHATLAFGSQLSLSVNSSKDSTLSCYHPNADNIGLIVEWRNGTVIDRNSNRDIIYHNCFQSGTLRYTVTIPSKPEYDGARIVCHAIFDDPMESSQPILTSTTTSRRTMNISVCETAVYECAACSRIDWLLNGTDLNNLTCTVKSNDVSVTSRRAADRSIRISTLSIIGQLGYNNTLIGCQALGSPEKLPDVLLFVHLHQCPESLTLSAHLTINANNQVKVLLTAHMNGYSDRVSDVSVIQLDSLDGLSSTQVVPSGDDSTLSLPRGRIWNCTVVACCMFATFQLSTHDLQNISVSTHLPGQITVTGDFIQEAAATDILLILYRRSDSRVFYELVPTRLNSGNNSLVLMNITGVDGGTYDVFVYVVEGNGTYTLATDEPQVVIVDSSIERPSSALHVPPPSIEYDIQRTSNGFNVTCISLVSRSTECVVVVHRKLPEAHNHLNVTLYVYQLGSIGDVISRYIYVTNADDFEVAVVGNARRTRTCKTPTPGWIIAVTVACNCFLLLVGLAIAAAVLIHRKLENRHTTTGQGSQPPQPQSSGTGPSIELETVQKLPHVDESEIPFKSTSPKEEMDKEVKHRKDGPLPRMNRPVGESDDDDRSSAFGVGLLPHQQQMDMEINSTLVS